MAQLRKTIPCNLSNISQRRENGTGKSGVGRDQHLVIGSEGSGRTEYRIRSHIRFNMAASYFSDVKKVVDARIVLRTEMGSNKHYAWGSKPRLEVRQITSSWSEGTKGEDLWSSTDYRWPSVSSSVESITAVTRQDNLTVRIDVTKYIRNYLPKNVLDKDGNPGLAKTNYGYVLMTDSELDNAQRMVFFSRHHGTSSVRPVLEITYEPVSRSPEAPLNLSPGTLTAMTPEAIDTSGSMTGDHNDPDRAPMNARELRIFVKGATTPIWTLPADMQVASPTETSTGHFSVPLAIAAGALKSQTDYEWDARTQNDAGKWGPYSARRFFRITSSAPVVTVRDLGTVETLAGVKFGGQFSDADGNPLAGYRIQLRPRAQAGDAIWDVELPLWDTGQRVPTLTEVETGLVGAEYTGRDHAAGTYSFRVSAEDSTGLWSPWSYGTVTVTTDYQGHDPGDYDFATIADRLAPIRVALYAMGQKRAPGALIGYIDEPINLGASLYLNGGGEVFFTLPATHPYCPEIEPRQVHYAVEQWWGDRYRTLFAGLVTDFDATPEEVVFYGIDYLGLFQTCVDERYDPNKPDEPAPKGSKYVNKGIDAVLRDQLQYHIGLADSQVGFLKVGQISAMQEFVTIYSTYAEALPFMVGLIDSHKGGTGVETRLYVHPTTPNTYEVRCIDRWGRDRENIRLEYGGLLNDFRVVGLGDFGTRVLGVGQKRGEVKVYRKTGTVKGLSESRWGRVAKTRFYPEIMDENDLQRRTNEEAAQVSKIGKRMALAIKADGLAMLDGWDVGDNIVIDIDRGVVDTTRFGSGLDPTPNDPNDAPYKRGGWWTIIGAEFHFYPDGHYETTLTVLPKKTEQAPDADLLPSRPNTISPEWQVGFGIPFRRGLPPVLQMPTAGPFSHQFSADFSGGTDASVTPPDPDWHPASTEPVEANSYIDLNTGIIYLIQPDGTTYAAAYNPATNIPDIPVIPPDTIPPDVPVVLDLDSDIAMQENGEDIVRLLVKVGYGAAPVGLDDLTHYVVQTTRFTLQGTDDPDWSRGLEVSHLTPDKTGSSVDIVISPVLANTSYDVRAAARDQSGNMSGWSAAVPILTTRDEEGPARPEDASLHAGMNAIGVRWSPVGAADLAHYEVRWKVTHEDVWTFARIRGTLLIIDGLANDVEYRVHVRSVDESGNVLHDLETPDADGNPTYETRPDTDLDAGWVNAGTATPKAVGGDALVWTDGMIQNLFAGRLRADWLTAGTLTVGGGPGHVDAITVINAQGQPVGVWNTEGLRILGSNPNFYLVLTDSGMKVVDASVPGNPVDRVTLSPLGIDAASITFGSQRGGHNLVQNSSFELGAYAQADTQYAAWDVRADWDATRVGADINITVGDGDLRMTAV